MKLIGAMEVALDSVMSEEVVALDSVMLEEVAPDLEMAPQDSRTPQELELNSTTPQYAKKEHVLKKLDELWKMKQDAKKEQ
jgi:hypothetical protein